MKHSIIILILGLCLTSQAAPPKKTYRTDLVVDDIVNVKSTYAAYEPIIIGCTCDPAPNTDLQTFWTLDDASKSIPNAKNLDVWAPEGSHWVELIIVQQTYTEIVVLVPDTVTPADLTKAKQQKIKIAGPLTINKYRKSFVVGNPSPVVIPVPPPGPGPLVPPVPPSVGPKSILILYETDTKTVQWGEQMNLLQTGPPSQYLDSNHHNLFLLDVDSKGSDGKPSKVISDWKAKLPPTVTYPVLIIIDPKSKNIVYSQSVDANITADAIISILKVNGG